MINTPRMRKITQLVAEYKVADPDTAVTEYFLRRLVAIKAIPITKSGKKILINKDVLEAYLAIGQSSFKEETKNNKIHLLN